MNKTYRIAEQNLGTLYDEVFKLNRRAAKLGCPPIELNKTDQIEDENIVNEVTGVVTGVRRFVFVEVSGESPKFAGWSLAAVVERTPEGNLLRKSPDCTIELARYRDCEPRCDHCRTDRNRRETYIVQHEEAGELMIGSNCLKDFLGHSDPHRLARIAELAFTLSELCEGAEDADFFGSGEGRGRGLLYVPTFLQYVALATRRFGFISSKREKEDMTGRTQATKSTALTWMFPPKNASRREYPTPDECDVAVAGAARNYVLETLGNRPADSLSDFEHNLLTAARCEAVEPRNAGVLAFIVEYHRRETEQAAVRAESKHFGEVGKRFRNVPLSYLKSTGFESAYGWTFVHSFATEDGAKVIWKTGTELSFTVGETIQATFTVKEHGEFKSAKQTKVSRLTW